MTVLILFDLFVWLVVLVLGYFVYREVMRSRLFDRFVTKPLSPDSAVDLVERLRETKRMTAAEILSRARREQVEKLHRGKLRKTLATTAKELQILSEEETA